MDGFFRLLKKVLSELTCTRLYIEQIYGGDFAKICGLLRIYEIYTLTLARPTQGKIQMLTTSSRIVTILLKPFLKPLGLYTFSMNLLSRFFLIRKTGKWINLLLVLILVFGLNWD